MQRIFDLERFQTIYAKEIGAVAAPTAGLHFSKELMKRLEIKGTNFAELTPPYWSWHLQEHRC